MTLTITCHECGYEDRHVSDVHIPDCCPECGHQHFEVDEEPKEKRQ